jgi:hypothetical protein
MYQFTQFMINVSHAGNKNDEAAVKACSDQLLKSLLTYPEDLFEVQFYFASEPESFRKQSARVWMEPLVKVLSQTRIKHFTMRSNITVAAADLHFLKEELKKHQIKLTYKQGEDLDPNDDDVIKDSLLAQYSLYLETPETQPQLPLAKRQALEFSNAEIGYKKERCTARAGKPSELLPRRCRQVLTPTKP